MSAGAAGAPEEEGAAGARAHLGPHLPSSPGFVPYCVGLGHSLYLSGPQFYTCKGRASDVIYVSRRVKK